MSSFAEISRGRIALEVARNVGRGLAQKLVNTFQPRKAGEMSNLEQVACEDLKAFERRLTEIIASTNPTTLR